ncbi:hypothetical protein AX16_004363 [Volvariella volvacea WC 439]|nr:hypothetical protein AX16_004363 [Volvariella volvacea WC 439]
MLKVATHRHHLTVMPLGLYALPILQNIPGTGVVSPDDFERLHQLNRNCGIDLSIMIPVYEEMVKRYSHPFFMAQLANLLAIPKANMLALRQWHKAQDTLKAMGLSDAILNRIIPRLTSQTETDALRILTQSERSSNPYSQSDTNRLIASSFISSKLPLATQQEHIVKQWRLCTDSERDKYLRMFAIETNQVEGIFHLTEESARGIIDNGIEQGNVEILPDSTHKDPVKIRNILKGTLAAYELVYQLAQQSCMLNKATICAVHARLMVTCRFPGGFHYIAPGETRTATWKTVIIAGSRAIQFCPFPEVDKELEYICAVAKPYIVSEENPVAVASWLHLLLARCHPFEDGNGRIARMIASIPLLMNGYPPMSISFARRADYFDGINAAYDGDHSALIECILWDMKEVLDTIKSLG